MHHSTRWQRLREQLAYMIALLIVCVLVGFAVYGFGAALGEPAVGIVLAGFVLNEIVWDVGPIIWKE